MHVKILLSVLLGLAAATSLRADFLYWMIDSNQNQYEFDYARIRVNDTDRYLNIVDSSDPSLTMDAELSDATRRGTDKSVADLSGFSEGSSFLLELYQFGTGDADQMVGRSAAVSYEALASYIYASAADQHAGSPFSGWQTVPEPTGGLLVIMGAALLGLKRKFDVREENLL